MLWGVMIETLGRMPPFWRPFARLGTACGVGPNVGPAPGDETQGEFCQHVPRRKKWTRFDSILWLILTRFDSL